MGQVDLVRRSVAEAVGTALLLAAVVGSGIMGERLSGGNIAIALLANTLSTGAALVALILAFGPISGAHFNPAVTMAAAWKGAGTWPDVPTLILAQIVGALAGVAAAHLMFGEPVFSLSQHARSGGAQAFSDTFAGIRPIDAPLFIAAQLSGAVAATWLMDWLGRAEPQG